MTSRVFIVENLQPLNYRNLEDFGKLQFLYGEGECPPLFGDEVEDALLDEFLSINFDPDLDFYAASGKMGLSHVALSCLIDYYGRVNCLLYCNGTKQYHVKQLGGLNEDDDVD